MADQVQKKTVKAKSHGQPVRLYSKARFVSFQRGRHAAQKCHTTILRVEGVKELKDTAFYMGKRVAYIYKAKREIDGSKYRTIWGRIIRHHGNSGCVRAKFAKNLPAQALGGAVRVMLYPSHV